MAGKRRRDKTSSMKCVRVQTTLENCSINTCGQAQKEIVRGIIKRKIKSSKWGKVGGQAVSNGR
jgi:hypothetical protein